MKIKTGDLLEGSPVCERSHLPASRAGRSRSADLGCRETEALLLGGDLGGHEELVGGRDHVVALGILDQDLARMVSGFAELQALHLGNAVEAGAVSGLHLLGQGDVGQNASDHHLQGMLLVHE